ncbi:Chromatin remodeling factor mit1 [Colletotrichum tanaceti]|uniref:Chromatin remodeling factor mit1 n=1 Tax=Colletotrichum tanaceti TaxID=1306861 RepID=A0A4U6XCW7_9PEZI|nr:Chromatin remodeling factor mit1 [Colletotrichum tanaceti]TKW53598.1 Chromatin remodeling factor mit1 [Colletotrichum tanaceti]
MDDIPTGADDDNVQPLGSPSDALFGLDNPDFDNPSEPISTSTPADERTLNDNADEAIATFDQGDFPTDGAIADIAQERIPWTEKDIQNSTHIDIGNDERISSTAVGAELDISTAVMSDLASVTSIIEPEDGHQIEETELQTPELRTSDFEIVLPYLSSEERAQYTSITSNVVNEIIEEVPGQEGEVWYKTEFTDGRQDVIPFEDLLSYENAQSALRRFEDDMADSHQSGSSHNDNAVKKRLWKETWDKSLSDSDTRINTMALAEDKASRYSYRQRNSTQRQTYQGSMLDSDEDVAPRRSKRQRTSVRDNTRHNSGLISDDEDIGETRLQGRKLRERTQKQLKLTSMAFTNLPLSRNDDMDELSQDLPLQDSDEDDDDFQIITSDLLPKPSSSRRKKSRRLRAKVKPVQHPRSRGSSIEFEDRRRSGRSTRNKVNMLDEALMDDESFYVEDTAPGSTPRVINIKEVFKPLKRDSSFNQFHSNTCGACSTGFAANKGVLIPCQGCSMSFHKACIGYRSAREHIVTKIGLDDFVLQCKFCIRFYEKKDKNSPRHDRCQQCKGSGRSCAAFSSRKTPKQEEKIRLENGGEDPITPVDPSLVNNADNLLFRCTMCKRGWHYEHLPSSQMDLDSSDLRQQRLSEYSVDWKCIDCGTLSETMQTLVAWRPADQKPLDPEKTYSDLGEDEKDYLIKWKGKSYFHCTWMPGAWVFHIAMGVTRTSFAKKDADQNLALHFTKSEAIPQEYLLIDIVFQAKVKGSARGSLEHEMDRIGNVDKIYVKFQGLGYDETVWDTPPKPDAKELYSAFKVAYYEYLTGKYFSSPTHGKMKERVSKWKSEDFVKLDHQPPGLRRGKLMEYQVEGVNWMLWNYHENKNVILADEMGLGKTVQVVGLISTLVHGDPKCWPFLIVVPNSTCPNWRREIKQWAPELRVVTYHGGKQAQDLAYQFELFPNNSQCIKAHVVVMSYDSAQDDRTKHKFASVQWAGLVVDEGQRLKNDKSILYTALRSMRFPFRLLLTGTPLQNNKRELFNLLQFVDPSQNAAKLDEEFQELNGQNLPELHGRIKQYFLRRTKAQVLKFLPPMAQIIVPVSMSILQEKLCKSIIAKSPDLIKAIFADGKMNKKERGSLNNILMQLRKCLCHPFMYSEAVEERSADHANMHQNLILASGKLMLLNIMLPKLKERGHRVLIFSQFLQQLDIIEDFLNGLGFQHRRLDGKINSLEKQKHIDAFNEPDSEIFAFLLSTRAGGIGINLATADTVIILDPDFNPHQDIQAISRAHRIGQKKKVLCFQLMTKNSAEEKIMQIGRKKMALDHVLIEAMDDEGEADNLESILKFGASALFSEDQDDKDIVRYDDASIDKLLDRSDIEQTKTGDDESAESQFSFARVWANDKAAFEDTLAEEKEPTVNPNVWEEILAEREAEAKRIAELNKEVLGRGGRRRRQAINYKTNGASGVVTDIAAYRSESSDNDGDFVGEDDDEQDTDTENRTLATGSKGKAGNSASSRSARKRTSASKKQQVNKATPQKTRRRKTQKTDDVPSSKAKKTTSPELTPQKQPPRKQTLQNPAQGKAAASASGNSIQGRVTKPQAQDQPEAEKPAASLASSTSQTIILPTLGKETGEVHL